MSADVTRPRFTPTEWANGCPAIDVAPYEFAHVEPVLRAVCVACGVATPEVGAWLDTALAETAAGGARILAHADNWTFSIAFERDEALRDRVLAALRALPAGHFDLPRT